MHWLDRAAAIASARMPAEQRPFNDGWGDMDVIEKYLEIVATAPPVRPITLTERPARRSGRAIVRDIEFESPYEALPDSVRTVRARWLTTRPEPERLVVLHPGWNDESYATRMRLGRMLLAEGVASVMPMHPFYGDRRRAPDMPTAVSTVSDFCLMGRGSVMEGRSLVKALHERGYTLGVAGYSMGGNIAGFVSTTSEVPVATAPIAASYSPGPVFKTGILRHTVAWEAFGGDTDEAVDELGRVIDAASILSFPALPHTAAAVLLAATKDGFVPNATTLALHRHWPGSKMEWVTAGHGSLQWRHKDRIVATIVESFDRFGRWLETGDADG